MKAVLDLKGRVGNQDSSITVKSNDPQQGNLKLSLVGNVISRVTAEPAILDFGRVLPASAAAPLQVKVQVAERFPLKILKAETSHAGMVAQLEELVPSMSYLVTASLPPTAPPGTFRGWVKLLADHPGQYREIIIPVQAYFGPGGPIMVEIGRAHV